MNGLTPAGRLEAAAAAAAIAGRPRQLRSAPLDALASPLGSQAAADLAARINGQEILRHLDGRAEISPDGLVLVSLANPQPFHLGGMETTAVNGSAILAMLDCALVGAGLVQFAGERCATLEMSVKFMRPVLPRAVQAVGYAVSKARGIAFVRADIYDIRNRVRATAAGIVAKL